MFMTFSIAGCLLVTEVPEKSCILMRGYGSPHKVTGFPDIMLKSQNVLIKIGFEQ